MQNQSSVKTLQYGNNIVLRRCDIKSSPDLKTRFKPHHKLNERYSETYAIEVVQKMCTILTTDPHTNTIASNPVQANTIKYQKEVCRMAGVCCRQFEYFKEKFTKKLTRQKTTGVMQINPYYSEKIRDLIDQIQDICECRLIYSGTAMDMFLLKRHYEYTK